MISDGFHSIHFDIGPTIFNVGHYICKWRLLPKPVSLSAFESDCSETATRLATCDSQFGFLLVNKTDIIQLQGLFENLV
jgi:hypothetical protein